MTVDEMLLDAMEQSTYVSISRDDLEGVDAEEGYVVLIGADWIALAHVSNTIWLDGWVLIRREHVTGISPGPSGGFESAALKARGQWPPSAPEIDLASSLDACNGRLVLGALQRRSGLVSLGIEESEPELLFIGRILSISDESVQVLEIDPNATWAEEATSFEFGSITRIAFGGDYENALLLVGESQNGKANDLKPF